MVCVNIYEHDSYLNFFSLRTYWFVTEPLNTLALALVKNKIKKTIFSIDMINKKNLYCIKNQLLKKTTIFLRVYIFKESIYSSFFTLILNELSSASTTHLSLSPLLISRNLTISFGIMALSEPAFALGESILVDTSMIFILLFLFLILYISIGNSNINMFPFLRKHISKHLYAMVFKYN